MFKGFSGVQSKLRKSENLRKRKNVQKKVIRQSGLRRVPREAKREAVIGRSKSFRKTRPKSEKRNNGVSTKNLKVKGFLIC